MSVILSVKNKLISWSVIILNVVMLSVTAPFEDLIIKVSGSVTIQKDFIVLTTDSWHLGGSPVLVDWPQVFWIGVSLGQDLRYHSILVI